MNTPDRRNKVIQVAYLRSKGFRPKEIARLLPWANGPRVSELLKDAQAMGYLAAAPAFIRTRCTDSELAALEQIDLGIRMHDPLCRIATRAGVPPELTLRQVHVLPSGGCGQTAESLKNRLERFAAGLAPELLGRITASRICGVTWGITLATAIQSVCLLGRGMLKNGKRTIVATCGEPFTMEPFLASSSHIAEEVNDLQGGSVANVHTLRGIPAFIPAGFDRDQILLLYHGHTSYGMIFGKSPEKRAQAEIARMDTVITSVGTFKNPPSTFVGELQSKSGCTLERLMQLTLGDIGGALVPRPNLSREDAAAFEQIAGAWVGISRDDLKAVVKRSALARRPQPGVIVLAIGRNKAPIIREVVRQGLVSELFIDQDLALELARLCGMDPARRLRAA